MDHVDVPSRDVNVLNDVDMGCDGNGVYGRKCRNYKVCTTVLPPDHFEREGNYICTSCKILFGTWEGQTGKGELDFEDNVECPICTETKECVSYPRCDHKVCIGCFTRAWYGELDLENEPEFPFPGIEDEYCKNSNDPKWDEHRGLIHQFEVDYNYWEEARAAKYEEEEYLRKCPICRS